MAQSKKRILDALTSPADLKLLNDDELKILCQEIRGEIIDVTSKTGGHVASSLGAVEIIVALHSVMNCPKDKIVYDVGHQSYAHKLLTGRLSQFDTLRQYGGISGFPKPSESVFDVHPSGHASDSLSVAFGLAKARDLSGDDFKIADVIGDSSLAGGMAFEALNHIGQEQTPMMIVLNDNGMSISRPVGALVRHLGMMRAKASYQHTRDAVQELMEARGGIGQELVDFGRNLKDSFKQMVIPQTMLFEQLGIVCTAPVDGHDITALREIFETCLESPCPTLVHVVTKKGKGYPPAEENPEIWHGVGPFDPKTGEFKKNTSKAPKYSNVFGDAIVKEAEHNPDVVAITAAMKDGTGLSKFAARFPRRFFDTGITEEHALGMAAGLSIGGKKPVVAIYSTFLQRAIDQIIVDNAINRENVVLCIDRAGLVGADGPTHTGAFDITYLCMIPNMRMLAPSNEAELVNGLHTAMMLDGPISIRYPRGCGEGVPIPQNPEVFKIGKSVERRAGNDIAILGFGHMLPACMDAAKRLEAQGISARVVDMRWIKPLDVDAIVAACKTKLVVTAEEGVIAGGAGDGVLEVMEARNLSTPVLQIGLPDKFVEQGTVEQISHVLGIDGEGIAAQITEKLRSLNIL